MNRIQNLQALRAIAAISVVLFHTDLTTHGIKMRGAFGVAIFFTISGFVMARVTQRESVSEFVRRRLTRIIPLYWLATLAAFIAIRVMPGFLEGEATFPGLVKSLLFIPYTRPDGLIRPTLFLGWTLNYEMLFYALVALGIALVAKRATLFAAAVIPVVMLAGLLFKGSGGRAYSSPAMLEFIAGVAAYYIIDKVSPIACGRIKYWLMGMVALSLPWIWFAEKFAMQHRSIPVTFFTGVPAFVMVLGALLLSKAGFDLKWRWVAYLGDTSYALYLLHPFVEAAFRRRFDLSSSPIAAFSCVVLAVLLAMALHEAVEKPLMAMLGRRRSKADAPADPLDRKLVLSS